MKRVTIVLDETTHKAAKIRAVMQDKSFMQYVVDLIKEDLETKKRAITVSLATDVITRSRNPITTGILAFIIEDSA